MSKLTNVRERVHQPFYDSLIRTSGLGGTIPQVTDREQLFTNRARVGNIQALTNLENGSTLPSDQSHVTLALRHFQWLRNPMVRGTENADGVLDRNGDFSQAGASNFFASGGGALAAGPGAGNAIASIEDVYRLHFQMMEQIHWSFGTGEKFSITNMPAKYFPDGAGISGDLGGSSDLIHWQNGDPTHTAVLRLARAVLLPPRQNVKCVADLNELPGGGFQALAGMTTAFGRNMLSVRDNLNAPDGMWKICQFTFDGLYARDVQ
jgi:hypothetical protein